MSWRRHLWIEAAHRRVGAASVGKDLKIIGGTITMCSLRSMHLRWKDSFRHPTKLYLLDSFASQLWLSISQAPLFRTKLISKTLSFWLAGASGSPTPSSSSVWCTHHINTLGNLMSTLTGSGTRHLPYGSGTYYYTNISWYLKWS